MNHKDKKINTRNAATYCYNSWLFVLCLLLLIIRDRWHGCAWFVDYHEYTCCCKCLNSIDFFYSATVSCCLLPALQPLLFISMPGCLVTVLCWLMFFLVLQPLWAVEMCAWLSGTRLTPTLQQLESCWEWPDCLIPDSHQHFNSWGVVGRLHDCLVADSHQHFNCWRLVDSEPDGLVPDSCCIINYVYSYLWHV